MHLEVSWLAAGQRSLEQSESSWIDNAVASLIQTLRIGRGFVFERFVAVGRMCDGAGLGGFRRRGAEAHLESVFPVLVGDSRRLACSRCLWQFRQISHGS